MKSYVLTCCIAVCATLVAQPVLASCGNIEVHAHRGARPAPENTVASIEAAANQGFRFAEIDIQMLGDGTWVLHHDALIGRVVTGNPNLKVAGVNPPVAGLSLHSWKTLHIAGNPEMKPSKLDEAILAAQDKISLHIEVKTPTSCAAVSRMASYVERKIPDVKWSTPFRNVATCLSKSGAQYVGLVVGPPKENEVVSSKLSAAKGLVGGFLKNKGFDTAVLDNGYDSAANRGIIHGDGIRTVRDIIPYGNAAIHLPASDISESFLRKAEAEGLHIAVYSDSANDQEVASSTRKFSGKPVTAIIDFELASFCQSAEK